jgi:hypothetical protein
MDIVIAISKKYNNTLKNYSSSKSNLNNSLVQTQIRKMRVIGSFVDEIFSSLNLQRFITPLIKKKIGL